MVTYSPQIRYSYAQSVGEKQQAIMDRVMASPDIEQVWDSEEVEKEILRMLN